MTTGKGRLPLSPGIRPHTKPELELNAQRLVLMIRVQELEAAARKVIARRQGRRHDLATAILEMEAVVNG